METEQLQQTKFNSIFEYDTILLESMNFKVVPSLGSIIPGWVLIVPKKFHLNFSSIPNLYFGELCYLIQEAKNALSNEFGSNFSIFEHGPMQTGSQVACGVNYAHLHLISTSFDLLKKFEKKFDRLSWNKIESFESLFNQPLSSDYLFHQNKEGECSISTNCSIPSQAFRKVIADEVGMPEKYDWKDYPFIENISKTISCFVEISD